MSRSELRVLDKLSEIYENHIHACELRMKDLMNGRLGMDVLGCYFVP